MSAVELIAVCFSLACIWLAVKKHYLNWPVGLIGVTAYLVLFYQVKLYADMALQIVFILQGVYGWYNWKKNQTEEELEVGYLSLKERILYCLLILIMATFISWILVNYTNASTPYVDSFVATVSLVANWLMAKKKTENWILWILADVIYIALFWYKELLMSSAIYIVFLILAIKGFIEWNKKSIIKKDLF